MRYANYQYTLTGAQQQAVQLWLRIHSPEARGEVWELLHQLTYTDDWTNEPKFEVATNEEASKQ